MRAAIFYGLISIASATHGEDWDKRYGHTHAYLFIAFLVMDLIEFWGALW